MKLNETGHKVVNNTTAVPGNWIGFTVITAAVVDEISYVGGYEGVADDLAGITLPANFEFRARIASIKLTSGSVVLWRE